MKSSLLALLALPILLGACSTATTQSAHVDSNPAISAGIKDTKWGPLPSYEPDGHRFIWVHGPDFGMLNGLGVLKVDILVNSDGTVRDVAIVESSSNPRRDRAAAAAFKKARYSLNLSPVDPAPYVVRYAVASFVVRDTMRVRGKANGGRGHLGDPKSVSSSGPQPDFSGAPVDPWSAR